MKAPINRQTGDPLLRSFFETDNLFPSCWLTASDVSSAIVNITEDTNGFQVDIIAPGFSKEDFRIYVEDNIINITASVNAKVLDDVYNGNFMRTFRLPENVKQDAITALYKDDVLKLSIPKQIPESKKEVLVQ